MTLLFICILPILSGLFLYHECLHILLLSHSTDSHKNINNHPKKNSYRYYIIRIMLECTCIHIPMILSQTIYHSPYGIIYMCIDFTCAIILYLIRRINTLMNYMVPYGEYMTTRELCLALCFCDCQ